MALPSIQKHKANKQHTIRYSQKKAIAKNDCFFLLPLVGEMMMWGGRVIGIGWFVGNHASNINLTILSTAFIVDVSISSFVQVSFGKDVNAKAIAYLLSL